MARFLPYCCSGRVPGPRSPGRMGGLRTRLHDKKLRPEAGSPCLSAEASTEVSRSALGLPNQLVTGLDGNGTCEPRNHARFLWRWPLPLRPDRGPPTPLSVGEGAALDQAGD